MSIKNIKDLYQLYKEAGVCIDTRKIIPGQIFFALKGPNYNANTFAADALEKGASLAVVDEPQFAKEKGCFLVEDVLNTLQLLAGHHRRQLEMPFLAITGSNGKTTTKELIREVLSKKYKVQATKGNFNNHIGVPLTVLSIQENCELAIIEMGANHVGEIAQLCKIARPDHGIITNIGMAHTEGFGSLEGVKKAKCELYDYLEQAHGIAFINSQNPLLREEATRLENPVFYPQAGDYYSCELISSDPFVRVKVESGKKFETQLFGSYNFENIAAALCIGKYFGVNEEQAIEALSQYSPQSNRSQVIQKDSNIIILDAYNANPESMKAALGNFRQMSGDRKMVILGDMKELGDQSKEQHDQLVRMTIGEDFQSVLLCGELIGKSKDLNTEARWFKDTQELMGYLQSHPVKDSQILIKASRSMELEKVMEVL